MSDEATPTNRRTLLLVGAGIAIAACVICVALLAFFFLLPQTRDFRESCFLNDESLPNFPETVLTLSYTNNVDSVVRGPDGALITPDDTEAETSIIIENYYDIVPGVYQITVMDSTGSTIEQYTLNVADKDGANVFIVCS